METTLKNVLTDAFWIMPATPKYKNQGIPYITSKNIKSRRISFNDVKYIDKADYEVISKNRPILENDILISMIGTLGEVAVVQKEDGCFYGQNMYLIRLDESKISQKYFLNWVESDAVKRAILQQQNKSTQSYLKAEHIEGLLINVPNMIEQDRVAGSLEKINAIIEKRKQQLQKLDEFVKARFVEMFGNVGVDVKNWGMSKLGDVCEVNPKKVDDGRLKDELEISFIPMSSVSENGEIIASEIKTVEEVKSGFTYFAEGDVIFAKITPCMENGKGAVARGLKNGIAFGSTEFHVLRPIIGKSNSYWIYYVTSFEKFRVEAEANMTGSAGQRRVPISFLENYKVSVPPIELQNNFADFVQQVDKSKLSVQNSLDRLEILKKALMQKYFG